MIELFNVEKKYPPNVIALNNLNLKIKPSEFVSIVGQSGAGKTTLVKILNAEESPDKGKIVIGGWDISKIKKSEIPILRRQIGIVFQDFKVLPKKTVYENIAFALEVCGYPFSKVRDVVPKVIKIVGLKGKEFRYPEQLSGGEQQRVAIARSLVHRPKILIADEPTGNLDSINTREIVDLLLKINKFGTTILLVTHNREVVNALKKRVVLLDGGTITSDHEKGKYVL